MNEVLFPKSSLLGNFILILINLGIGANANLATSTPLLGFEIIGNL